MDRKSYEYYIKEIVKITKCKIDYVKGKKLEELIWEIFNRGFQSAYDLTDMYEDNTEDW